ncbi:hypothetical protein IVA87_11850 [Bradyrhizobium sp. 147]|uniref:hypothetical protein n=1 Tax=unclassified Bradyrhizobium TaxID=2631580 RepID=UPI001FF8B898|nr:MULTISPECIES: hypothetical protein [unclassified Bradyrhizobium]MCK1593403.1 hypothetical protein [Bradyrhizobium sp. 164]MCK1680123.1 hypothetical protein [Bradyrhizobium sp. 147]
MSYTNAAFSFWWTRWNNNYEVFAVAGRPMIGSASLAGGEHCEDHSRILLSVRGASNVLDDLSEPKDI